MTKRRNPVGVGRHSYGPLPGFGNPGLEDAIPSGLLFLLLPSRLLRVSAIDLTSVVGLRVNDQQETRNSDQGSLGGSSSTSSAPPGAQSSSRDPRAAGFSASVVYGLGQGEGEDLGR